MTTINISISSSKSVIETQDSNISAMLDGNTGKWVCTYYGDTETVDTLGAAVEKLVEMLDYAESV